MMQKQTKIGKKVARTTEKSLKRVKSRVCASKILSLVKNEFT